MFKKLYTGTDPRKNSLHFTYSLLYCWNIFKSCEFITFSIKKEKALTIEKREANTCNSKCTYTYITGEKKPLESYMLSC